MREYRINDDNGPVLDLGRVPLKVAKQALAAFFECDRRLKTPRVLHLEVRADDSTWINVET